MSSSGVAQQVLGFEFCEEHRPELVDANVCKYQTQRSLLSELLASQAVEDAEEDEGQANGDYSGSDDDDDDLERASDGQAEASHPGLERSSTLPIDIPMDSEASLLRQKENYRRLLYQHQLEQLVAAQQLQLQRQRAQAQAVPVH